MEEFKLTRTPDGDELEVDRSGPELLRIPLYNKGAGFTLAEGVAAPICGAELDRRINQIRWRPEYLKITCTR